MEHLKIIYDNNLMSRKKNDVNNIEVKNVIYISTKF